MLADMTKFLPFLSAFFLVNAAAQADNCEPLRARIEANIASKGITDFSVTTVDADATAPGEVVGTCALGTKKIVYARGGAATSGAVPITRPQRPTPDEEIWVECKDGSMVKGGGCKP